jgi:hypothetical protein
MYYKLYYYHYHYHYHYHIKLICIIINILHHLSLSILRILNVYNYSELLYFVVPNWKKVFRFWTFFLSILQNYKVDSGKNEKNRFRP